MPPLVLFKFRGLIRRPLPHAQQYYLVICVHKMLTFVGFNYRYFALVSDTFLLAPQTLSFSLTHSRWESELSWRNLPSWMDCVSITSLWLPSWTHWGKSSWFFHLPFPPGLFQLYRPYIRRQRALFSIPLFFFFFLAHLSISAPLTLTERGQRL